MLIIAETVGSFTLNFNMHSRLLSSIYLQHVVRACYFAPVETTVIITYT